MKHKYAESIKDMKQEDIAKTVILIGGCGAIGSNLAVSAAHAGFRVIKVVDMDVLEEHNLENQMYTTEDIGLPKVEAIAKLIKKIDPTIQVISIQKPFQDATDEELKADVYLSGFDNFGTRFSMNGQYVLRNKPMIDAGIDAFSITIRIIIPGETPCLECWPDMIPKTDLLASCSKKKIPSLFNTAQVAAGLQIAEVFKVIHGWPITPYYSVDLRTGKFNRMELERNSECPLCSIDWKMEAIEW